MGDFEQDTVVRKPQNTGLSDHVLIDWGPDIVVEYEPGIHRRTPRFTANLDGDGLVGGVARGWHFFEILVCNLVKVRLGAGADIAFELDGLSEGRAGHFGRYILGAEIGAGGDVLRRKVIVTSQFALWHFELLRQILSDIFRKPPRYPALHKLL